MLYQDQQGCWSRNTSYFINYAHNSFADGLNPQLSTLWLHNTLG